MALPPSMERPQRTTGVARTALWSALALLIAAALVSVVWVVIGDQDGIVGRAFLTIFLLTAFAGVVILDTHLAPNRPVWFVIVSISAWCFLLLIGAIFIWVPAPTDVYDDDVSWSGPTRFFFFLLVVLIVQLAVLHVRLYVKAMLAYRTILTQIIGSLTLAMVGVLVVMLVFPLVTFEWLRFTDIYGRLVVAVTILAAVGTVLLPLLVLLLAPRRPKAYSPVAQQGWPTYADGYTPLPMMPDGSPDWQAYWTGQPTFFSAPPAQPVAPVAETEPPLVSPAVVGEAQPPAQEAPQSPSAPSDSSPR